MKTVFGIDLDTWTALNAIGAILGAFGALAASIVALYLGRRDYYPRLRVSSAIMCTTDRTLELVTITGTNIGHTAINVLGTYWTFGWLRKQVFITVPFKSQLGDQLPKQISHSQQVDFALPFSEFKVGQGDVVAYLKKHWCGKFLIRSLRCGFFTTNGDFSSQADPRIQNLIRKLYDGVDVQSPTGVQEEGPVRLPRRTFGKPNPS